MIDLLIFLLLAVLLIALASATWALDSLTAFFSYVLNWNAAKNVTGTKAITSQDTWTKKAGYSTAIANATQGGANEQVALTQTVSASSSVSIDLTSLTDVVGTGSVTGARVKAIVLHLLSATDDTVLGTAAASVTIDNTVTNALSAQSHSGWFDNAAEGAANGSKFTIPNGGWLAFGTDNAGGVIIDSTHKVAKLTNNDGALAAKVRVGLVFGTT